MLVLIGTALLLIGGGAVLLARFWNSRQKHYWYSMLAPIIAVPFTLTGLILLVFAGLS